MNTGSNVILKRKTSEDLQGGKFFLSINEKKVVAFEKEDWKLIRFFSNWIYETLDVYSHRGHYLGTFGDDETFLYIEKFKNIEDMLDSLSEEELLTWNFVLSEGHEDNDDVYDYIIFEGDEIVGFLSIAERPLT